MIEIPRGTLLAGLIGEMGDQRRLGDPKRRSCMDLVVEIAAVGVAPEEPRFREPLERDADGLAGSLDEGAIVVLLGSIATGKYVDVIERRLGARLRFPSAFVGRGDMSRGGLMLRSVASGTELDYVAIAGAVRRGRRPPKL